LTLQVLFTCQFLLGDSALHNSVDQEECMRVGV